MQEEKKIEKQDEEYDDEDLFPPEEEMIIDFKESIKQNIDCWGYYEFGHWNHDLDDCSDTYEDYIWVLEKIASYEAIELTKFDKIKFRCFFKKHVYELVKNYENEYDLDKIISALSEAIYPILIDRIPKDKKFYRYL